MSTYGQRQEDPLVTGQPLVLFAPVTELSTDNAFFVYPSHVVIATPLSNNNGYHLGFRLMRPESAPDR